MVVGRGRGILRVVKISSLEVVEWLKALALKLEPPSSMLVLSSIDANTSVLTTERLRTGKD